MRVKRGLILALCMAGPAWAGPAVFMDFDALPQTETTAEPGDGGDWWYTTKFIHSNSLYYMTIYDCAGWRSTNGYASAQGIIFNSFNLYLNTYNSSHMGFATYGYLEIDGTNAIQGNSLRYTITGGVNGLGTNGLPLTTKAHYTNYIGQGQNPAATNALIGHPCLYFVNSSVTPFVPFPEARGANRLSMYFHAPATLTNRGERPMPVVNIGPYNGAGDHWYHEFCTQGGGWTHALCDGHPQHNNSWSSASNYPYPSRSLRDMGTNYFTNMYRWYITFKPYEGIGRPVYTTWFDEVEFLYDDEPQNNETICSPSITWLAVSNSFEVGFMDKYKNCSRSYSTYEVRYSFEPINNANWSNATPAHILTNAVFRLRDRADGKFQKFSPYYQSAWAPFTLANTSDLARLVPGRVIHFAIKDISQINGDSMLPVTNSGIGPNTSDGRNYELYGTNFDYAGDAPALPLIKRIDFRVPKDLADQDADGLPDWWETAYFGGPTNADPAADPDGDRARNLEEYLADTLPQDSNSTLNLIGIASPTGNVALEWRGGELACQFVECRTNGMAGLEPWRVLATNRPPMATTGGWSEAVAGRAARCYRLRTIRQ